MGQTMSNDAVFPTLTAALALACLSATSVAAEAHDEDTLEQIVVVAHKDERSIRDVAANVTVLSRAQLNAELATSIGDVFRYVPGIDYEAAGTRFGTESINIRGIGGNRVAMLVDGVPLTDQFDTGSFSNATRDFIDAGLIQNIEVLHGPASALYGSAAIGGVVAANVSGPRRVTLSAPAAFARTAAAAHPRPSSRPARSTPVWVSPAPLVSTGRCG